MGDAAEATARLETSVAVSRAAGVMPIEALVVLGLQRWHAGDDSGADAALREGLAAAEAAGDPLLVAYALRNLAHVARTQEDLPRARALVERSVETLHEQHDPYRTDCHYPHRVSV